MKVYYGPRSRLSGRLLQAALRDIEGDPINFGYQRGGVINTPKAVRLAGNKRKALEVMAAAGVPVPELYEPEKIEYPCVARPDKHYGGKEFYLCREFDDWLWATEHGATHFMQYIEGGREFRLHIAFGKSIKIAEKIGEGIVKNFDEGSTFMYPQNFHHKKTIRAIAKAAVMSLGLDFGAVDVIYKNKKYYVLEVNSAPGLTSNSDVLDRYVAAFKENAWI